MPYLPPKLESPQDLGDTIENLLSQLPVTVYFAKLCYVHAVPSPMVTLTVLSSADCRDHVVGGTFSVQCQATVSHHVNTPVSVNITWGGTSGLLNSGSNSRVTISETTAVPGLTYRSTLTLSDLSTGTDSNMNYYCQAAVTPDPVSSYILASTQATSNMYLLTVCGMLVMLLVISPIVKVHFV